MRSIALITERGSVDRYEHSRGKGRGVRLRRGEKQLEVI